MLIEDKTLWLEALRSGEYKQTAGFLKVEREGKQYYCCIGVLCEIFKDKYEIAERMNDVTPGVTFFDDSSEAISDRLISALKLEDVTVSSLYGMNDDDKLTFAQIADWIEAHVEVSPEATAETNNA